IRVAEDNLEKRTVAPAGAVPRVAPPRLVPPCVSRDCPRRHGFARVRRASHGDSLELDRAAARPGAPLGAGVDRAASAGSARRRRRLQYAGAGRTAGSRATPPPPAVARLGERWPYPLEDDRDDAR